MDPEARPYAASILEPKTRNAFRASWTSPRAKGNLLAGVVLLVLGALVYNVAKEGEEEDHLVHSIKRIPSQWWLGVPHPAAIPRLDTSAHIYGVSAVVREGPGHSFRDNLRADLQYITAWNYAGWTNDFIGFANLLYLASISSRIPIIPSFPPSHSHIGIDAKYLQFGDVFDLPRLQQEMKMPILEWREVKHEDSHVTDAIGCWSPWATLAKDAKPRHSVLMDHLKLDIAYTSMPIKSIKPNDMFVSYWELAAPLFPKMRAHALRDGNSVHFPLKNGTWIPPDEQLACLDHMYFVTARKEFEWEEDYSPVWRFVGTHIHWNEKIVQRTDEYLRRMFSTGRSGKIPQFISIHIRRDDFKKQCKVDLKECMAPLSAYQRRVEEIQKELYETRGIVVDKVVVTSDENDPEWWKEVTSAGWYFVDHKQERTIERFGKWYPAVIEAVIQSKGIGFVGTAGSTMSLVAARRVQDWNDGITREVKWGRKGADN